VEALALSNAERQRAWRERQKGKPRGTRPLMTELAALRARVAELEAAELVKPAADAAAPLVTAAEPVPAAVDEARRLAEALNMVEYLKADRDRWYNDCLKAEAELKQEELRHRNTRKDKIVLQQEIAAMEGEMPAARGRRMRAEIAALRKERDALLLLLNQIRSYAPKIPDEARAWAEKQ
jgi:hypothetical protein